MKLDLPPSIGEPLLHGSIKQAPIDFIVKEQLNFEFDDEGEHLYLHIRKCGLNTSDISEYLQSAFKCRSVDIGISGLKDKRAITDQWFSVRTSASVDDEQLAVQQNASDDIPEGKFQVLESHRHTRKLRRGAHQFNQFVITITNVKPVGDIDMSELKQRLTQRLNSIEERGFANYFGPQRFGHNAQNLVKADRMFKSPKRKISRVQRGLLLSSARSHLFNAVCAARVRQGTWNLPMNGEPMLLAGTNSYFVEQSVNDEVRTRTSNQDIHTTGPLWGRGEALSLNACGELESQVLAQYESFKNGLESAGLEQQRRALRAQVFTMQHDWLSPNSVKLSFKLLKGVYATSLLAEFMVDC